MKMTFSQYEELRKKGLTDAQIVSAAQLRGVELPSEGFIGGLLKATVLKPAVRTGQAIGAVGARLAGVDEDRVANAIQQDQILKMPFGIGEVKIEGQKPFGEGGGKQIAADVLEAGATYMPYGRVAKALTTPASQLFSQAAAKVTGYVGAGAVGGYGMDVAGGLRSGEENPYNAGVGTFVGASIPAVPALARQAGRFTRFVTSQVTGLSPETITTILTNPKALTTAQIEHLDRASLASQVKDAFSLRMEQLTHSGKEYEQFKNIEKKIRIRDTTVIPTGSYTTKKVETDIPTNVLKKYGITISNGRITRGPESTPLTSADRRAIEDFISDFGGASELTPKGLLNTRRALDNLSKYDKAKSDIPEALAREMRHAYDTIAKREIPGLKELDDRFAPEIKNIQEWKKDFFNPDGTLKDAAINKIANSVGEGKNQLLARLEKLVPGIGQKAQVLKALEDIGATEGAKVGTYFRAGNILAGGAGLVAGGPVGAVVSAVVASPAIAVPIIKTIGRVRGWADDSVMQLVSKLETGKHLSEKELVMYRAAISDHIEKLSPGDQFLDTPLGQKVQKYNAEMQPGMSTRDVTRFLHPEDKTVMEKFIDHVRIGAELSDAEYEMAEKLAERFTINMNTRRGMNNVADKFEEILTGNRDFKATMLPGTSDKAHTSAVPQKAVSATDNLITEAKKYDSLEEFVTSQTGAYHGSSKKITGNIKPSKDGILGEGFYITNDPKVAESFAKSVNVPEGLQFEGLKKISDPSIKPILYSVDINNVKLKELGDADGLMDALRGKNIEHLRKELITQGYDGIALTKRGESVIFPESLKKIKVKQTSQLTDIWNKAHSKSN